MWRWPLLLLTLGLAACASAPRPRPVDAVAMQRLVARETALRAVHRWSLQGRIAISLGGGGGSGRVDWEQDETGYRIRISAPVTRRSWQLRVGVDGAVLEGIEGGPFTGPDARALLRAHIGWDLPLASLARWVRGMRASRSAQVAFTADGRLARIEESGWRIDYRGWDSGAEAMPTRVFAERADARVRLVIDHWQQVGQ